MAGIGAGRGDTDLVPRSRDPRCRALVPRRLASCVLGVCVMVGVAWLLSACGPPPPPCGANWIGPADGDFNVAGSWSTGTVPDSTTVACAPVGSSIVVSDTRAVSSAQLAGTVNVTATGTFAMNQDTSTIGALTLAGTLAGDGPVTITTLSWTGGAMNDGGATTVLSAPTSVSDITTLADTRALALYAGTLSSPTIKICDSANLTIGGQVTVDTATDLTGIGCGTASTGTVTVAPTGTLTIASTTTIERPITNTGTIRITGTASLDATNTLDQSAGLIDLASAGSTLRLNAGTATFTPTGGTIAGIGTIDGHLAGTATLAPGPSAGAGIGTLAITGTYTATAGTHVAIDLAGTTPGVTHDQLTTGGTADVTETTIDATYGDGYTPTPADTFTTMTSTGALTGPTAAVTATGGTGTGLHATYTPNTVVLAVNACDSNTYHAHANLMRATVGAIDLEGCNLYNADLDSAIITGTTLAGVDLRGASLVLATFQNVDFSGADMQGSLTLAASFNNVAWYDTTCPDGTNSNDNGNTCSGHLSGPTFDVNVLVDATDAVPGDGQCETVVPGQCTLRAAIQEANASIGPNVIQLHGVYQLGLAGANEDAGASGDLDISDSIQFFTFTSATIDAAGLDRALDVLPGASIVLGQVTITGGDSNGGMRVGGNAYLSATVSGNAGPGATVSGNIDYSGTVTGNTNAGIVNTGATWVRSGTIDGNGTGINNTGWLRIENANLRNSTIGLDNSGTATIASTVFDAAGAAGIVNTGGLTVTGGTIKNSPTGITSSSNATISGATITSNATGVQNSGTVTLTSNTITTNATGVDNSGTATLTSNGIASNAIGVWNTANLTTAGGNTFNANGVGIDNSGVASMGSDQVRAQTVSGIHSTGSLTVSGAIIDANVIGIDAAGTISVADSTISSNTSPWGGLVVSGGASITTVERSTITHNSGFGFTGIGGTAAIVDSTIAANGGAGIKVAGATITTTNSIHAPSSGIAACDGAVASGGWNLASDATCNLVGANDIENTDPQLGRIGSNGGPTSTFLPLMGSPVIDSGKPGCFGTDQRGFPRPVDGDNDTAVACDRGAVEVQTYHPLDMTVNSNLNGADAVPGDGICQTAVAGVCTLQAAIGEGNATFGPDTVNLAAGQDITANASVLTPLTIHGNGAQLDSISVNANVDVVIDHVTWHGYTGLSVTHESGHVTITDSTVGPIYNAGILTLERTFGLERTLVNAGTTTIDQSTFYGGSGIVTEAGATTSLVRTTMTGNGSADPAQAALVNRGTTTLVDSTISRNTVKGINNVSGTVTATNSIVADQVASPNCAGSIVSLGWNLSSDASCGFTAPNDLQNTPAQLAPAAGTLDTTYYNLPMPGSPAIDSGKPGCSGLDPHLVILPTDGDGVGGAQCDRGAVELGAIQPLTLTVNDVTVDARDARPGDGICQTSLVGQCTLRAAIEESNVSNGTDTIDLPVGASVPVTTSALQQPVTGIWLAGNLTIHGNGSTIPTVAGYSILGGAGSVTIAIDTLTVASVSHQTGSLTMTAVNTAVTSSGALSVTSSTITGATISGSATLDRVSQTSAASGIVNWGTTIITDSTLMRDVVNHGQLDIVRTSITRPIYTSTGSAISTIDPGSTTSVTDSTLAKFPVGVTSQGGTTTITNSTITENTTGQIVVTGGTVTITNSLISGATGSPGCTGPVSSGGFNIAGDSTCALTAPGDLDNTNPSLVPVATMQTRSQPITGSPAIDSGGPTCSATDQRGQARPLDGDGNGSALCDRGAIEVTPPTPLSFTVNSTLDAADANPGDSICETSTPGQCTLSAAITETNAVNGADTITLQSGATYTPSPLAVASALTLHGNDAVITNVTYPILIVGTPVVSIDNLDILHATIGIDNPGGQLTLDSIFFDYGGTGVRSGGTLTGSRLRCIKFFCPTAVDNRGSASISDSSLAGNSSPVKNSGALSITRSTIGSYSATSLAASLIVYQSTVGHLGFQGSSGTITDSTIWSGVSPGGGAVTVTNSILIDSSVACTGPVLSAGYNLSSDSTCGLTAGTDLQNTPANLFPLTNNGGSAETMLPMPGSAATDTGKPGCTGTDQRGQPRPRDGDGNGSALCDRGAVEAGTYLPSNITVTSTLDVVDADVGDGVCETATPGECTLRAAVQEADELGGADTITLQNGATYTLTPTNGVLLVRTDMTILGNNSTIDANLTSGWFALSAPFTLAAQFMTLSRSVPANISETAGISVPAGATIDLSHVTITESNQIAISSSGVVSMTDSTIQASPNGSLLSSTGTATILRTTIDGTGSGIYNYSQLTLTDSVFQNNTTPTFVAVTNRGTATILRATVTNSAYGFVNGTVAWPSATMSITASVIEHNLIAGFAAVQNFGTATIVQTTVDDNTRGIQSYGTLALTSSTISRTAADPGVRSDSLGAVTIRNSTISGNLAGGAYVGYSARMWIYDTTVTNNGAAGIWTEVSAVIAVQNSIVANQASGNNCFGGGLLLTGDYNVSSDGSCSFTGSHDVNNTSADLGILSNNGGLTLTHMPNVSSPTIDTGRPGCPALDQRGVARPRGVQCDRGSVEW